MLCCVVYLPVQSVHLVSFSFSQPCSRATNTAAPRVSAVCALRCTLRCIREHSKLAVLLLCTTRPCSQPAGHAFDSIISISQIYDPTIFFSYLWKNDASPGWDFPQLWAVFDVYIRDSIEQEALNTDADCSHSLLSNRLLTTNQNDFFFPKSQSHYRRHPSPSKKFIDN